MEKSKNGLIEKQPEELLKNPYIFEFAGLKENKDYFETDLEKALLNHLTYMPSKEELIKIIQDEKELIELTRNEINENKEQ